MTLATSKKKPRKEHGNSTWSSDKRKDLIEVIRMDMSQKDACKYVGIAVSTLHDWLSRDKQLMEEYTRAERYMDYITSRNIQTGLDSSDMKPEDKVKFSFEYKKRRDKRYRDKQEVESTTTIDFKGMTDEEIVKAIQK